MSLIICYLRPNDISELLVLIFLKQTTLMKVILFAGLVTNDFEIKIENKDPKEIFGKAAEGKGTIKGGFDKKTNTVWIFSQNHENIDDIRATIREELLVRKGNQ